MSGDEARILRKFGAVMRSDWHAYDGREIDKLMARIVKGEPIAEVERQFDEDLAEVGWTKSQIVAAFNWCTL